MTIAISLLHKELNLSLLPTNMPMLLCYHAGAPFRGVNHVKHGIETSDAKPNTQRHILTLLFNYSLSIDKLKKWLSKTF